MKTIVPPFISFHHLKAYSRLSFILTFVTLMLMLTPYLGQAQISQGGTPLSFSGKMVESYPIEIMPAVDIEAALKQDALDDEAGGQPYRFGINIPVNINVLKQGETQILAGGNKLIRQGIRAAGALTINLTFSKFRLPKGAKLFIYNKDKTHVIGAFTDFNNQEDHKFGTILLKGDEITLEYFEPANVEFKTELTIGIVTHGYKDAFGYAKAFGSSGSCETNVNCPVAADWACEKQSVVMLVVGGNGFCTGALVNNTNQNKTPYVLTANHCLSGVPNVSSWVFYFNWESATCANPTSSPTFQSMSGATLKANNGGTDVALVQINTAVPDSYNASYAGWSRAGSVVSSSYGIHHPSGDIKKFSASENPTQTGSFGGADCWRTGLWTLGVTEPGSSGSPLFDPDHLIIGQLYGGPSSCTTSAANKYDYYGKFHVSWSAGSSSATRLKEWLDPAGTNPTSLGSLCAPPPCTLASSTTQVNVLCNGSSTGSIDLTVSGGVPAYTYNWGAGQPTTQDRSGLVAGTYTVTVTDANGCTATNVTTITQPPALVLTTTQVNVLCFGSSTGSIDLTVSGGVAAYTYNWGAGQPTTQDRTSLVAGSYTVTVMDANGCTASKSTTITQPPVLVLTTTQVNVTCPGDNNGSIDLTVSGGTPGYTYNWGAGQPTTQDRTGVTAGSYTVTVTDANGCTASKATVVNTTNTVSTAPTSISGISTICSGGSTILTLVGGSAGTGATAKWYSASCGGTPAGTGNSITVSPTTNTSYFVRYEGTCNTTTCASVTVSVEIAEAGTLSSDVASICKGGSVKISRSSTNGTLGLVVFQNDLVIASLVSLADVESFLAQAEPGQYCVRSFAYTTTPHCSNFAGLTLSQMIDACFAGLCYDVSDPLCITVKPPSVAPTNISGTTTICNGQSTSLSVIGGTLGDGAIIEWFTGSCGGTPAGTGSSITVSPTVNTTYFVRYKGTCNTTACASQLITVNTLSTAPLSISGVSTICNGGSTTLTLVGGSAGTGATAKWFTGSCGGTPAGTGNSITVSPTTNTTYFVRYEGTCNTTACALQLVTVNTLSIAPTGITGTTNICLGNNTTLTLTGGFAGTGAMAEWFTGSCVGTSAGTGNSIIVAPTVNTTYYVRYKGTCNTTSCASVTVTITIPSVGGIVAPAQNQGCGPQTVNLTVSGITGTVTRWERQTNCNGAWASIGNAGLTAITVTTPNASTCYRAVVTNGVCPSANSAISTITVDKPAVGGRVTLQSNQSATSIALCPSQNALLIPLGFTGKVATWQYSFGTSSIWYDLPGTAGQTTLTVNGSSISGTVFYRVVIVTELSICTGAASLAYSTAFRITKKAGCSSPDGSITSNEITNDKGFTIVKTYPNPATLLISLDIDNYTEGVAQLEIWDVTGRQVLKQTASLTEGLNSISLDISQLSRGIFIVKMTDSQNQKAMVKMVKE